MNHVTSGNGTFETCRDVRSLVASEGKADIEQAATNQARFARPSGQDPERDRLHPPSAPTPGRTAYSMKGTLGRAQVGSRTCGAIQFDQQALPAIRPAHRARLLAAVRITSLLNAISAAPSRNWPRTKTIGL
jgi:hypothetical protein